MIQDNASSSVFEGEFPIGVIDDDGVLHTTFMVREMKGAEENILASRNIKPVSKFTTIIGNCLQKVGPHTSEGDLRRFAEKMTSADRIAVIFALRRVSFGDAYNMTVKCPACKVGFNSSLDLSTMEVKPQEEPEKREFETEIKGHVYKWHVLSTPDELWLEKQKKEVKEESASTLGILSRLDAIDGKPVDREKKLNLVLKYMGEVPSSVLDELRHVFDETEGDVDTKIEFECPECGFEFQSMLELNENFFSRLGTSKR